MSIPALLIGGMFGVGILLIVSSFHETPKVNAPHIAMHLPANFAPRFSRAVIAAVIAGLLTRWPVGAIAAGLLGWFFDGIFGTSRVQRQEIARTEAIATWTEMLRDTLSGAHGIEETITTSADIAPVAIRNEVITLASALDRESLDRGLQRFAVELAHPTGDLVVTALRLAATDSTRDLADLLGTLADAARDECGMRLRVEAARARMRTAVRVITACTLMTAIGLATLNRHYLAAYDSLEGQAVLALVVGFWVFGLRWLSSMSRFAAPQRFLCIENAA